MKRVFLIENPVASQVTAERTGRVRETLETAGHQVTAARTEGPGDATRLAALGAGEGHDVVVVYGGDGTVMQAVAGMQGTDAVLGVIPGGTGNLLAGNLRIPKDPVRAAALIAAGVPRTIDLVHLTTSDGPRYYAVGAGTGYDADMMAETPTEQKERWGILAYVGFVLRTAHRIRPQPVTITIDGRTAVYPAASVLVANCAEILPPVLKLGRQVTIDDGILDVVILNAHGVLSAVWTVVSLLTGRETQRVRRLRGTAVRVETVAPQPVEADGDVCGCTPFEARVLPGALRVMAPAVRGGT